MINGAIIAPKDCVEKAAPIWVPVAPRLAARKVPMVTYHEPQTKNSRNIIIDNLDLRAVFISAVCLVWDKVSET